MKSQHYNQIQFSLNHQRAFNILHYKIQVMVFYRVSDCSGDRGHSIASSLRSQTFRFISLPKDVTISLKPLLCKNATPYWQALVSVTWMNHIFPRRKKRYTLIKFCDKISFKVNCVFYYLCDFVVRDIKIAAYLQ